MIKDSISKFLKGHSFTVKGNTWYSVRDDVVQVLNLQKSQWGAQYYVNLGVWVKAIEGSEKPPSHKCHIQMRLSALSHCTQLMKDAFDEETKNISETQRDELVVQAISQAAIPFFDSLLNIEDIKKAIQEGSLKKGMVHAKLKEYIAKGNGGSA
jgi:hypothetical protein